MLVTCDCNSKKLAGTNLALVLVLVAFSCYRGGHAFELEEPRIYSRYDYDYRMLKKLTELETKQTELLEQLEKQRQIVEELRSREKQTGSTYHRWGKRSCQDNGTVLVYEGYMSGTAFTHDSGNAGGGGNYLCLPADPLWAHYKDGLQNGIRVTGVTYEFNPFQKDIESYFGSNILRQTASCALCRTKRSTSVMIPGRNRCYPGWTEEYRGYLATGYPGYSDSSEFVCIDQRPDVVTNTAGGDKDNYLYLVETECGKGLPCAPYVSGRELPCVLCSL